MNSYVDTCLYIECRVQEATCSGGRWWGRASSRPRQSPLTGATTRPWACSRGELWLVESRSRDRCAPLSLARVSSDLALARDPAYRQLVEEFAANRGNFETEFAHAW